MCPVNIDWGRVIWGCPPDVTSPWWPFGVLCGGHLIDLLCPLFTILPPLTSLAIDSVFLSFSWPFGGSSQCICKTNRFMPDLLLSKLLHTVRSLLLISPTTTYFTFHLPCLCLLCCFMPPRNTPLISKYNEFSQKTQLFHGVVAARCT